MMVDMSMMLVWHASVIEGCERRKSRISDAPLDERDNNHDT